jgi:ribosomal protein L13
VQDSDTDHLQKLFEKSKGKYRTIMERVLDKIFQKKYPNEVLEVSIRSLLTWDKWPVSMKVYSKPFLP